MINPYAVSYIIAARLDRSIEAYQKQAAHDAAPSEPFRLRSRWSDITRDALRRLHMARA